MTKNKRIQNLYFGVLLPHTCNNGDLMVGNLFDCSRCRYWAAKYRLGELKKMKADADSISYIFGDVWSRSEFEFLLTPFLESSPDKKLSLYEMYVLPNRELLLNMIDECSENSARQYIRDMNKLYHPTK